MGGEIIFVLFGITEPTSPKKSTDSDELDLHQVLGGTFFCVQKKRFDRYMAAQTLMQFFSSD